MAHTDRDWVAEYARQSADFLATFAADAGAHATLVGMAERCVMALRAGGKLLVAGNGGSAGDAQHIAGEFVGRFLYDRAPMPAIALTVDTSVLTAVGNDYGYEHVFERQVRGLGRPGDVFLAISTSGNSPNLLRALEAARDMGIATMGFSGPKGGAMADLCDILLRAPGPTSPFIQQVHITAAHIVCALVERAYRPAPVAAG